MTADRSQLRVAVAPFRALRYDVGRVGDLGRVWAPPYDVISSAQKEELEHGHDRNIVRITLPGPGEPDRYAAAADRLTAWIEDGTLVRDREPAVYVHRHHFTIGDASRARTGLWALVRMAPLDAGIILPHERTMKGPKADRLALMRATATQLSPVFFVCSDRAERIAELLTGWGAETPPDEQAEFPAGERHEIWRVKGEDSHDLASLMSDETLLIADGHHRYETALAYRDELVRSGARRAGRSGDAYVLACLVSERDSGLVMQPTHRVLAGAPADGWESVLDRVTGMFDVQQLDESQLSEPARLMEQKRGRPAFALVTASGEGGWLLELKPGQGTMPAALTRLAAVALHDVFMPLGLELEREEQEEGGRLTYTGDAREALRRVRRGSADAAFLMAEPEVGQIREAARAGERLPPKTTFFLPKVPTGLAMHLVDPREEIDEPHHQPPDADE